MSNKTIVFLVAGSLSAFALGGCTSYGEIKEMTIERHYEHTNTLAEPLSACMHDRLLELGRLGRIHRTFDTRRNQ